MLISQIHLLLHLFVVCFLQLGNLTKSRGITLGSGKKVENTANHLNTIPHNGMSIFFVVALSLVACFELSDHDDHQEKENDDDNDDDGR